ncbi:hypothetical protein ACH0CI_25400 [Priestia sp. 179-F W1.4 NHS]|uniref:hypothetical protein n=1 Tax=Priestia sp. 179-F W1.4 NHS TaxID=3374296 RepID=UPI0038797ED8
MEKKDINQLTYYGAIGGWLSILLVYLGFLFVDTSVVLEFIFLSFGAMGCAMGLIYNFFSLGLLVVVFKKVKSEKFLLRNVLLILSFIIADYLLFFRQLNDVF